MDLEEHIAKTRDEFKKERAAVSSSADLAGVRTRFLGKKAGAVTDLFRHLGTVSPSDRPRAGALLNELKGEIETALEALQAEVQGKEREAAVEKEALDVTLPGRPLARGSLHPVTHTRLRIESIFQGLGYSIATGPEVETDFHNFEALNMPPDHPARDAHDTFYVDGGLVLRTHTSPVQIRSMLAAPPPLLLIAPGRVYRRDYDLTHLPMFHQVEGLAVGPGVSFSDLKGTLTRFVRLLFGKEARLRFRASYFPFVEPGAEVDISCTVCGGGGCRTCKMSGWLEILGSGMVHPAVFEQVESERVRLGLAPGAYDPARVSGFAFGMGIDRIAMLLYRIDDLRIMIENDARFLEQFPG